MHITNKVLRIYKLKYHYYMKQEINLVKKGETTLDKTRTVSDLTE